jgi:hypothetical protein
MQTLTISTPGTYAYCYRYSEDNGMTYVYGDLDANIVTIGSTNGFSPDQTGTIIVTP